MKVELRKKPIADELKADNTEKVVYKRIFEGKSGTGFSEITASITISSEDQAAVNMFGATDKGEMREFTLGPITNLGDFTENKKPGEED